MSQDKINETEEKILKNVMNLYTYEDIFYLSSLNKELITKLKLLIDTGLQELQAKILLYW